MAVVVSATDTRTVTEWGNCAHLSSSTLKDRCRVAGLRPKASLDFARLLRAVVISDGNQPQNVLDVLHERTLRRLMITAGLTNLKGQRVSIDLYVSRQQFVLNPHALDAIGKLLTSRLHAT